ncbi:permease [Streptomyces sp. SID4923]|nr:hypothetical protein [Streptomyces sp. LaPpAH-165]MYQ79269.1 permease [Streptomyces sp. SID4923]
MSTPLLRLYPAGYRRAFGADIAEAYREATEGAGRTARFREAGDLVAHALRMRLRLGAPCRSGPDQAAAAGAVHRKAPERPNGGAIRSFRQRREVPCQASRTRP